MEINESSKVPVHQNYTLDSHAPSLKCERIGCSLISSKQAWDMDKLGTRLVPGRSKNSLTDRSLPQTSQILSGTLTRMKN